MFRMGLDPGVGCLAYAAWTLWLLGYLQQALARLHEALALVHELSHPYTLAWVRSWAVPIYQLHRDVPAVYEHPEATVALSTAQGFPLWAALGTSMRGWALALQDQREAGTAQVRQGVASWRATSATMLVPYLCTVLADVAAHLAHRQRASKRSPKPTRWWSNTKNASGKRKSIVSRGSCSCGSRKRDRRRRKPGCGRPWTSPAARRRKR